MIRYKFRDYGLHRTFRGVLIPTEYSAGTIMPIGNAEANLSWDEQSKIFEGHFKTILKEIAKNGVDFLLYLEGPLDNYELPPFLIHICDSEYTGRYYLPEAYCPRGRGYVYSSVAFDYTEKIIENIFNDDNCTLQMATSLIGVLFQSDNTTDFLKIDFRTQDGVNELFRNGVVFFECAGDFEGVTLASKIFDVKDFFNSVFSMISDETYIEM